MSGSEISTPEQIQKHQFNPILPQIARASRENTSPLSNQLEVTKPTNPPEPNIQELIRRTITEEITRELILPLDTNFPTQEGITETNITEMVEANQLVLWNDIPGPRIYCFLPFVHTAQDTTELGRRSNLIYDFFLKLHLEETVSINPSVKAPNTSSHRLAYPFLIGSVPEDHATILTHIRCWVLKEVILFFFPESFTPSPYAVTLKGFLITDKGPSDAILANKIHDNFTNIRHQLTHTLTLYNTKPNGEVDEKALQEIVNSVRVSRIRANLGKDIPQTLLRIYINPPTLNTKKYEMWLKAVQEHTFVISAGQGTKEKDLICELCKVKDHVIDMCEFKTIPNWPTDHPQKCLHDQTTKAAIANKIAREKNVGENSRGRGGFRGQTPFRFRS